MRMSRTSTLTLFARPITSEAEIDLTGASIDPDRLIAGQRARRPKRRIAGNVRSRMQHQRAGVRWRLLVTNDACAVMVSLRVVDWARPCIVGPEGEDGRERDDGSDHVFCPVQIRCSRLKMILAPFPIAQSATSAHRPPRYFRSIVGHRTRRWRRGRPAIFAATRPGVADRPPGPVRSGGTGQAIP